jgi:microcystin-dependent protein
MALDASSTEEARIALSAAGPIPNAVLYNNAKDLAAAMVAGGVVFGGGGGGAGVPVGTIIHTGQSTIPAGFLDCDGSSQLRNVYPDLFDAIGTTYGPGAVPGTTFALPTVTGTYGNFAICADAAAIVIETQSLIGAPIGTLLLYADSTYPTGWLRSDGTAISRTTYADLFAIIGTTYGAGDGSTTFNLPNLSSSGTGSPVYIIKAILSGSVEPSTVAHASSHIRAGTDVIDGDRVQVDYVPSAYTRNAAASGAGAVTDLTAHLSGIDNKFGGGSFSATGGTVTTSGSYTIHTFTSSSTFIVATGSRLVDILIVGGGGNGGGTHSGGGAGGEVVYVTDYFLVPNTYNVIVGAGAVYGSGQASGGFSIFDTLKAYGGGTAGNFPGGGNNAGATIPFFHYNGGRGGSGGTSPQYRGGGGAGAGASGSDGNNATSGGAGLANSITGTSVIYAGGGGGGRDYAYGSSSLGGTGGGGQGGSNSTAATAGTTNTGGGGGGGGWGGFSAGKSGGSGIVIVRYLT